MKPLPFTRRKLRGSVGAFTLVEIVMAIGIVSFAIFPIMALLPIGLQATKDSMERTAIANISQQIRGELQQIAFSAGTDSNITNLSKQTHYYTQDGVKTVETDRDAYYIGTFDVNDGVAAGVAYQKSNAQTINITLKYPKFAPDGSQRKVAFSIFTARQPSINN